MNAHKHFRMCSVIFLSIALFMLYTCTQTSVSRNLSETSNTAPPTLLGFMLKIQHAIMRVCNTKSTDLVFVSDPYFAVNYVGDSLKGYGLFYQLSLLHAVQAQLYLGFEIESDLQSNFDIATSVLENKTERLDAHDTFLIRYAERVVVSPLLHVFAPSLYEDIVRIRTSEDKAIQTINFDASMYDSRYITADYSDAMYALGTLAAEQATHRAPNAPRITMLLDSTRMRIVSERARYFVKAVLQHNPAIELQYIWNDNFKTDASLENQFRNISDDALVLFDIGSQAYSMLFTYINKQDPSIINTQSRVMIVDYLNPEHIEYVLPTFATVFIPNDFVFQKNFQIKTILNRYNNKE